MKKTFSLLICIALCMGLAACSEDSEDDRVYVQLVMANHRTIEGHDASSFAWDMTGYNVAIDPSLGTANIESTASANSNAFGLYNVLTRQTAAGVFELHQTSETLVQGVSVSAFVATIDVNNAQNNRMTYMVGDNVVQSCYPEVTFDNAQVVVSSGTTNYSENGTADFTFSFIPSGLTATMAVENASFLNNKKLEVSGLEVEPVDGGFLVKSASATSADGANTVTNLSATVRLDNGFNAAFNMGNNMQITARK